LHFIKTKKKEKKWAFHTRGSFAVVYEWRHLQ